jgi:hypothetical protein
MKKLMVASATALTLVASTGAFAGIQGTGAPITNVVLLHFPFLGFLF